MSQQSTNHILMIEPAEFYANPETMETNVYQVDDAGEDHHDIFLRALDEFRTFRNKMVTSGVNVTTAHGHKGRPDMLFPNWVATLPNGKMMLCPMLNENRRAERVPEIINVLARSYDEVIDWTAYEHDGLFLESTGSICLDHINKIVYSALSRRTSRELVEKWADLMGYDAEIFDTMSDPKNPDSKPVYHTDLVMNIGTTMASVCASCIVEADRERVVNRLKSTHEVMELSIEQLRSFCGNALEVQGRDGTKMLAISGAAHDALNKDQLEMIGRHYASIIHSPLPTIEKYGGGSARCLLLEVF
ncbi:MAG: hypothetical protein DHS20C02_07800 [Micavibrio sp.]|nr:MAG: hypothetical protein DHS20C02_07800 [Micavibrio sp.]